MLVDYTLTRNDPTIHKWYRDAQNNRVHETEDKFEPYFFIKKSEADESLVDKYDEVERIEHGSWISNMGIPLSKVVLHNPKDTRQVRSNFEQRWESDIFFRMRYWIDEVDGIRNQNYRVVHYDIEVDHSLDVENAPEPVTSVTAHDNYKDKYISFLLEPEEKDISHISKREENWSIYTFTDERKMLNKFLEWVKGVNPDIMTAWNDGYDKVYLVNRMRNLKIDYSELSPIREVDVYNGSSDISVKGREMIDMIEAFQKVYFSDLESYSLNNVGASLLGTEKIKMETSVAQLWRDNPEKMIEYNKKDVEIMVMLDDEFKVWDMLKEVQDMVGINISDTLHNSRNTKAYFMRQTDRKLPEARFTGESGSFEGATVLDETPGLSKNVAVLDLKAQYPSAMMSFNMSPEMKIEEPKDALRSMTDTEVEEKFGHTRDELQDEVDKVLEEIETITTPQGSTFRYDEIGFVPEVLTEMIQKRDKHKEIRDQHEPGDPKYEEHDRRQYALKFVINSVYGVMGHEKFPLYDKDIAASTTTVGRDSIDWAVEKAEELGYEVIYGDTDSIMISMGEDVTIEQAVDKAKALEEQINNTYDDYAEKYDVDTSRFDGVDRDHFFEIEFEKLYKRFFMINSKKKYAGLIRWKEGKRVEDTDFAQFGKRSDMSQLSRDVVEKVIEMILYDKSKEEIQEYITEVCNNIKNEEYSLDYIGIPSKMKKEPDEYKTDRPIVRAVKHSNKHHSESFVAGDKPKYLYVNSTPRGVPTTDVVAYDQVPPGDYRIDYDTMVQKDVQQKLRRILNVMDYDWNEMYRTSASLLDF